VLSHNSFNAQGRLAARAFYISVRLYLAKLLLLEFEKIPYLIAILKIHAVFGIPLLKITGERPVKEGDGRNKLYRAQNVAVNKDTQNVKHEPNAQKKSAKLVHSAPSVHKAHYLFTHNLFSLSKIYHTTIIPIICFDFCIFLYRKCFFV
jgi:hypothetical protein